MLHGIEMDVVDMALEITLVANRMFPETTLPQRNLSAPVARDRRSKLDDPVRKPAFDKAQSNRVVRISFRQGPTM